MHLHLVVFSLIRWCDVVFQARRLVPALRSAILDNDRDHMFRCAHGIAELAKNGAWETFCVEKVPSSPHSNLLDSSGIQEHKCPL